MAYAIYFVIPPFTKSAGVAVSGVLLISLFDTVPFVVLIVSRFASATAELTEVVGSTILIFTDAADQPIARTVTIISFPPGKNCLNHEYPDVK